MWPFAKKTELPTPEEALPGRDAYAFPLPERHLVSGRPLLPPHPEGLRVAHFGMGCFWGAERLFWRQPGVWVTAVGYMGGFTPHPTYEEVCTGLTGHAEVVRVVWDPRETSLVRLLRLFFENHDPTQGMRQGNDVGIQYRSVVFLDDRAELELARRARDVYAEALRRAGWRRPVTTEVAPAGPFWYAEPGHQQYLARHPHGYCGLRGTGVAFPEEELAAGA
ncbi:Peptide methionine sulfoxide reductase MsrA [bacterium HR39]|nr:Peptide methionine sulfoxide reductase MsrA [bacterium HR39]